MRALRHAAVDAHLHNRGWSAPRPPEMCSIDPASSLLGCPHTQSAYKVGKYEEALDKFVHMFAILDSEEVVRRDETYASIVSNIGCCLHHLAEDRAAQVARARVCRCGRDFGAGAGAGADAGARRGAGLDAHDLETLHVHT